MTTDANGDVLVYCGSVRRIRRSGAIDAIVTFTGHGFSGDGGPASQAKIGFVNGIAADGDGNLYLLDNENRRIRVVRNAI